MTINADNLSFTYGKGTRKALNRVSFSVDSGEIFGFLGPSGAGKSTTLGLLTGTLTGYEGQLDVGGTDPSRAGSDFYRSIGVCFESPRFHDKFTAGENLRLFGALYGKKLRNLETLMARVGLASDVNKRVGAFSKGMKTRLSLVRSLLHDPQLLFLDEPTNGLDPSLSETVRDLIREERDRGKTVFLTTHDMDTAASLCHRVGFLVDGELVLVDRPDDLAQQFGTREVEVGFNQNNSVISEKFPLDGLADHPGFHELLRSGEVKTIHTREAELGDIFRRVTGRNLV